MISPPGVDPLAKVGAKPLDKTAEKVLLVVDDNQALIGTLTDGDIRRYILKGQDLSGTIENAYNRDPIFLFQKDLDSEKMLES